MKKYGKNDYSNKTSKIFNDIIEKLQAIIDNGDYEKFLKLYQLYGHELSDFRGYSFNNLILIFSQFPDATQVAR